LATSRPTVTLAIDSGQEIDNECISASVVVAVIFGHKYSTLVKGRSRIWKIIDHGDVNCILYDFALQ
jgi:hypothetical protein